MAVERRGPAVGNDSNKKEGKGEMIKTPISLQDLRRSLYVKAKAEPTWRFWGLYVHICKMETLQEAYWMAKSNDGAPGIDGVTFAGEWVEKQYGISIQGWGSWSWDWIKAELISRVIGTILIWLLYVVIRRSARRWWFYFWLITWRGRRVSVLFATADYRSPVSQVRTPATKGSSAYG